MADSPLRVPARVAQRILTAVLVVVMVGGCSHSGRLLTKGTMPPPGPDGMVDPSSAPDFIAVAGREEGIAGWVAKSYVFPTEHVVKGRPGALPPDDPPEPVYADDLRTLVGYMVVGKGFVPLVDDPIVASTGAPIRTPAPIATPSSQPLPAGPRSTVALYVRNVSRRTAWVVAQPAIEPPSAVGFDGGAGGGCFAIPAGGRLLLLDRSPKDGGSHPIRVIVGPEAVSSPSDVWLDIAGDGSINQGDGVPDWWSGDPIGC